MSSNMDDLPDQDFDGDSPDEWSTTSSSVADYEELRLFLWELIEERDRIEDELNEQNHRITEVAQDIASSYLADHDGNHLYLQELTDGRDQLESDLNDQNHRIREAAREITRYIIDTGDFPLPTDLLEYPEEILDLFDELVMIAGQDDSQDDNQDDISEGPVDETKTSDSDGSYNEESSNESESTIANDTDQVAEEIDDFHEMEVIDSRS